MKNFIAIFGASFILFLVFLFFGGFIVFENIWATITLASLITSIIISGFLQQDARITDLEARLLTYESETKQKG